MPIDEEEATPVMLIATCRTPGCVMDGVGVEAPFYSNAPAGEPPIYQGHCAQCEQPVTDLVPVTP
ncbi:hypothetical protein ACIG0A_33170 [Streptomyces californicus]|uniref:hypothetical protein n=1 Tax=Streptomyces californicus TaxID=67351 RepID=UPI0037D82E43